MCCQKAKSIIYKPLSLPLLWLANNRHYNHCQLICHTKGMPLRRQPLPMKRLAANWCHSKGMPLNRQTLANVKVSCQWLPFKRHAIDLATLANEKASCTSLPSERQCDIKENNIQICLKQISHPIWEQQTFLGCMTDCILQTAKNTQKGELFFISSHCRFLPGSRISDCHPIRKVSSAIMMSFQNKKNI